MRILRYRYGLVTGEPETLDVIGTRFGLTRERIRQIEKKALERCRGIAAELAAGPPVSPEAVATRTVPRGGARTAPRAPAEPGPAMAASRAGAPRAVGRAAGTASRAGSGALGRRGPSVGAIPPGPSGTAGRKTTAGGAAGGPARSVLRRREAAPGIEEPRREQAPRRALPDSVVALYRPRRALPGDVPPESGHRPRRVLDEDSEQERYRPRRGRDA